MENHHVRFENSTGFSVFVCGFVNSRLMDTLVGPGETCIVRSDTDEWHIDRHFGTETPEWHQWKEREDSYGGQIGKFRSEPCARGDYSWMSIKNFDIIVKDNGKLATFIDTIEETIILK